MRVLPYKTHKILPNENLYDILDRYLPAVQEKSVVVITSKVVSLCEGRVVKKISEEQKNILVRQEADYYLPEKMKKYGIITIKNSLLLPSAGIDLSNSNGYYCLWPQHPQTSVNTIRTYLRQRYRLKQVGVVLTDSRSTPLRRGITGWCLVYSGFRALSSYVGKQDLFGYTMQMEQTNVADSLANAAVLVMGEGNEQQPLAVITDVPFVQFQERNPTKKELAELTITPAEDIYSPLLTSVAWEKGGKTS